MFILFIYFWNLIEMYSLFQQNITFSLLLVEKACFE